ncbi:MAG TPA: hypothetical protein VF403_03795, partial [Kofleriaceae bacterium]
MIVNNVRMKASVPLVAGGGPERNFSFRPAFGRLSARVSVRFVVGLMIVGAARQAAAERVIDVDAAGAPFEARDLVAAIRVRAAIEGAPVHLLVTSIDHGVRVAARGGVREVNLGGLTGTAAARLVALAANDLL